MNSRFALFGDPWAVLTANELQCLISNRGEICFHDGGFWPTGSPNQYMWNSGLQIAGMIPEDAGFAWAGDTVGAYFFDQRGTQQHGEGITDIYDSLDPEDWENWPDEGTVPDFPDASAFIRDGELFDLTLLGRKTVSEQDSWVLYWDGNPAFSRRREHPMGILVEQRTLAWNYPKWNEATIFFILTFKNVTNDRLFQRLNEDAFFGGSNGLPDEGWRIDSIYVALNKDPDVTVDFDENYGTAIVPLDLALAYDSDFLEPARFEYSPLHFHQPFFRQSPGLIATKFVRTPTDPAMGRPVGQTLFSSYENPSEPGAGQGLLSPLGIPQLWRYLSGNIVAQAGDVPCQFPDPKERRLCFLKQRTGDTYYFQSTGPFSLQPGESETVIIAMFAAATVETDQIVLGDGAANAPGIPSLRPGCEEPVRPIEVGAGWVSTPAAACAGLGDVDLAQIEYVPGSLVGKALVAQAMVDNGFTLPAPPEPPEFALVPEHGKITVVWAPSPTEEAGDPFYALASDSASPLHNPNYRRVDVEGYRIYRGRRPWDLKLIAQFDKRDTKFVDRICETDPDFFPGAPCDTVRERRIIGRFIQYPFGGVVNLDGHPFVAQADTALAARIRDGTALHMVDSGIETVLADTTVENGFQYYYKVTAFDINSLRSGPSSLESSGKVKAASPRVPVPNLALPKLQTWIAGDDGEPLDPGAPFPSIDSEDGTFSSPMPPSDAFEIGFAPLVERLLPQFKLTATIDSVVIFQSGNLASGTQEFPPSATCPSVGQLRDQIANPFGACWAMHLTVDLDGTFSQQVVRGYNPWWSALGRPAELDVAGLRKLVPYDPTAAEQFGIAASAGSYAAWDAKTQEAINHSTAQGPQARRFGNYHGGSRWFSGENESVADPAQNIRVGHLDGVDTVWAPISHTPLTPGGYAIPNSVAFEKQCFDRALAFLSRAADVEFTWQGGTFGSVRDVTHNVDVPFHPKAGPTWGFLTADSNGNGVLDWQDFNYIDRAHQILRGVDGGDCDPAGGGRWDPAATFTPVNLASTPSLVPTSTEGLDEVGIAGLRRTGEGFGLFIFGERYIFELSRLPADGTKWTLRTYSGSVEVADEDAANPSGYEYDKTVTWAGLRPMLIPGLTFNYVSESATRLVGKPDLPRVHTVPDPYYAASRYDPSPAVKRLLFVNLPARATIRIYSLSGILVDIINHDDPSGGGQADWDLRNRSNEVVASGVYFFHVTTPDGRSHIGKFTIINAPPF
jgi:hypothetical protein